MNESVNWYCTLAEPVVESYLFLNGCSRMLRPGPGTPGVLYVVGTTTGAPAIFPRWTFGDLLELRGDRGAQMLLRRYSDRVVRVPMPRAAIDIDTPEDLLELNPPQR